MTTRYAIWIGRVDQDGGRDVLYFDDQRQPSQGFPPVVGDSRERLKLIWPLTDIDVSGGDWDAALIDYSPAERKAAEVRVLES